MTVLLEYLYSFPDFVLAVMLDFYEFYYNTTQKVCEFWLLILEDHPAIVLELFLPPKIIPAYVHMPTYYALSVYHHAIKLTKFLRPLKNISSISLYDMTVWLFRDCLTQRYYVYCTSISVL